MTAGLLEIGHSAAGQYKLSGGTLNIPNGYELINQFGSFIQSGGTNTVAGVLQVGDSSAQGNYTLSNGKLAVGSEAVYGFLTQSNGTHTITGDMSIFNSASITGGSLTGSTLTNNGTMTTSGSAAVWFQTGGTNAGTINFNAAPRLGGSWRNTGTINIGTTGAVTVDAGTQFLNQATLNFQTDGTFGGPGAATLTNAQSGVIVKSGATGTTTFGTGITVVDTGGAIDVESGILTLSGPLSIQAAMLEQGNGTLNINGTQSHVGGTLTIVNGTVNFNSANTPPVTDSGALTLYVGSSSASQAKVNFTSAQNLQGFVIVGGTATASANVNVQSFDNHGTYNQTKGIGALTNVTGGSGVINIAGGTSAATVSVTGLDQATVNINLNGTLLGTGTFSTAATVKLNDTTSEIDVTNGNEVKITSALGGTGNLTKGTNLGTLSLQQTGVLTFPNVTVNGGNLNIGPASGLTNRFTVSNALTITNSATVTFVPTASAATSSGVKTNSATNLLIGTNGLLDLQNHFLTVDNTATPFTRVKQYIDASYHNNLTTHVGDYAGRGGITSSVVAANAVFMGVGYYNGALQDPNNPNYIGAIIGPNSNSGHGTGIPYTQILIRPTLIGDVNGDGVVNSYDVGIINSLGLYNSSTNLGWQVGDWNGDGVYDTHDVTIYNTAGNFNNGQYLIAVASSKPAGKAAARSTLTSSSDALTFTYDPATGDLKVHYNGFAGFAGKDGFNTTTHTLSMIDIQSTGGAFALNAKKLSAAARGALPITSVLGNTEINLTGINGYLPDGTDLGAILTANLDATELANALTLTFNYTGSRQLSGGFASLSIAGVPEPTSLGLLGIISLGLLRRRRAKASV